MNLACKETKLHVCDNHMTKTAPSRVQGLSGNTEQTSALKNHLFHFGYVTLRGSLGGMDHAGYT